MARKGLSIFACALLLAAPALAQTTSERLALFEGDWTGAGETRTDITGAFGRLRCDLTADYDARRASLSTRGDCKADAVGFWVGVQGRVRLTDAGAEGLFIDPAYVDPVAPITTLTETGIVVDAVWDGIEAGRGLVAARTTTSWTYHDGDGVYFTVLTQALDPATGRYTDVTRLTFTQRAAE